MRTAGLLLVVALLAACAQVQTEQPALTPSADARCVEFAKIANDMSTTAYRRATAVEQLRAQRCPGY